MGTSGGPPPGSFLGMLDAGDREVLQQRARTVEVAPGGTVFLEGDRSERVVVVTEGLLRVGAVTPAGVEFLLAVRGPGDLLGDQAALDDGLHGQTVFAMQPAQVLSLGVPEFLDLLGTRPGISMALHRVHVSRLREADHRRVEQATLDVATRLARRLVEIRELTGEDTLALSQRELAGMVGASREAVTKGLARLASRGAISTSRGATSIVDIELLASAANHV